MKRMRLICGLILLLIGLLSAPVYSGVTAKAETTATLKEIKTVKAVKVSTTSLKVKWSKTTGADGYIVYEYNKKTGKYKTLATLKGTDKTSYVHKKLKTNSVHYYAVRTYRISEGKTIKGPLSYRVSAKVYNKNAKSVNANKIKFSKKQIIVIDGSTSSVKATASAGKKAAVSKTVRYYSSNPQIATVDKKTGVITGVSTGTCKIIGRAHNGYYATIPVSVQKNVDSSQLEIVGHRGAMDRAPEDTLASVKKAYELGYKSAEVDIWNTNSGDWVVFHDYNLTRLCGKNIPIYKINATNRFNYPYVSGSFLNEYETQYISLVSELLQMASQWDINLYLHVKTDGPRKLTEKEAKKLAKMINKYGMKDRVVVFAGTRAAIETMSKCDMQLGYLTRVNTESERKEVVSFAKKKRLKVILFKFYEDSLVPVDIVNECHKSGIKILQFSLYTRDQAARLVETGVDAGVTNRVLFD